MISNKKSRARRREFLIDSNQKATRRSKRLRNRSLNFLAKVLFLRQILKMFRESVLFGILFFVMAAFILFAFFSPYFTLKKIIIVRDNPNLNVQQIETSLDEFYGKNLFILSHSDLQAVLSENFPEFRSVKITEKWPDQLEFKIEISPPAANLQNMETANFAVISDDGVILSENADESLPIIKVFQHEKIITARQRFVDKETFAKIFEAERLYNEKIKLPVKELHFYFLSKEIHLVSSDGMVIWLDAQVDIAQQIRKLELGANEIKLYSRKFEHIDLRIPERVIHKAK